MIEATLKPPEVVFIEEDSRCQNLEVTRSGPSRRAMAVN